MVSWVTSNHYDTLRVLPGAEDAVIRAAFRALIRLYHPDANSDPNAQARAQEIIAAFAVLGDPGKRAAYDTMSPVGDDPSSVEKAEFATTQLRQPLMRNVGLACVVLALALSLTLVVQRRAGPASRTEEMRKAAPISGTAQVTPLGDSIAKRLRQTAPRDDTLTVPSRADISPALPQARTHDPIAGSPLPALPVRKQEMAQLVAQQTERAAPRPAESSAVATCYGPSSYDGTVKCRADQAQVERMAEGYLDQSMAHADLSKRRLLLSAFNRSIISRKACGSGDCVADASLRQIREITGIMEGRRPIQ